MTSYTAVATGTVTATASANSSLTLTISATVVTVSPYSAPPIIYMGDLTRYDIADDGITVTKSINDSVWGCEGTIVGAISAPLWEDFSCTFRDHQNIAATPFYGPLVGAVHTYEVQANKSRFRGFGYEYYLTKDKVRWMHLGPYNYQGDGTSTDPYAATVYQYPAVSSTTAPSEIVFRLLQEGLPFNGGNYYQICSPQIEPYNIMACTTYGTLGTPYRQWHGLEEDYSVTLMDLIKEICDTCNMVFEVIPYRDPVTGDIHARAYFVPWSDVDVQLGLPVGSTIIEKDNTDNQLLGAFEVEENADDQVNHVHIRGYGWNDPTTGLWLVGNYYSNDYNDERERLYDIQNIFMEDSAACNSLANYLGRTLTKSVKVYRFKLWKRFDLRLYQQIRFLGWDTTIIPEDWLRIISITYARRLEGDFVECEAITDTDFINIPLKNAALTNEVTELAQVMQNIMKRDILPNWEATAAADRGDGTWDVTLQDGRKIRVKVLE